MNSPLVHPTPDAPITSDAPDRPSWRCFHCDEVFTTIGGASDHFGPHPAATPGCVIDKVAVEEGGKPQRGRGLLMALRQAELELDAYRQEDTDLHRYIHRLQCEHQQALLREEEKGYRRGLIDGDRFPNDAAIAAGLSGASDVSGATQPNEQKEVSA